MADRTRALGVAPPTERARGKGPRPPRRLPPVGLLAVLVLAVGSLIASSTVAGAPFAPAPTGSLGLPPAVGPIAPAAPVSSIIANIPMDSNGWADGVGFSPNYVYGANAVTNGITVAYGSNNTVNPPDLYTGPVSSSSSANPAEVAYDTLTNRIFISNYNSNNISVFNASTNRLLAAFSTTANGTPASSCSGPRGLLVVGGELFVGCRGASQVNIYSTLSLGYLASVSTGSGPFELVYAASTGDVYVSAHTASPGSITVINPKTNAAVGSAITLTGYSALFGEAFDPLSNVLYVVNGATAGVVTWVYLSNNTVSTHSIAVGNTPRQIAYDGANGDLYVDNSLSDTASVIATNNNTLVQTIGVGNTPYAIGYDAYTTDVYVVNENPGGVSNLTVLSGAPAARYPVTVTETGLPSGSAWSMTIDGVTNSSTSNLLLLSEANGTYGYTLSTSAGYLAPPGTLTVAGPTILGVRFSKAWVVSFSESGLPSGTAWTVDFNGTNQSSTTGAMGFSTSNGSFSYSVIPIAGFSVGAGNWSGTVAVAGANVGPIALLWRTTTYGVTFTETGLASGLAWSASVGAASSTSSGTTNTVTVANGTYVYVVGSVAQYSVSPASGTVGVSGLGSSIAVTYTPTPGRYSLTFNESGLPSGLTWTVTLNGTVGSAHAVAPNVIAFQGSTQGLRNATYSWSVTPIAGYTTSFSGTVAIAGAAASVAIVFVHLVYAVSFTESGLPSGSWGATLNGNTSRAAVGSPIGFSVGNGTFSYNLSSYAGYSTPKWKGSVVVSAASTSVATTFTAFTYKVTFAPSKLPSGATWYLNISGQAGEQNPGTTDIVVSLPNGTYAYGIATNWKNWTISPALSTFSVAAAAKTITVTFALYPYAVTIVETGLPNGATWYANVSGEPSLSNKVAGGGGTSVNTSLSNGTYAVALGTNDKNWTPSPGTVGLTVSGASASKTVSFVLKLYAVTFQESGLLTGLAWTVGAPGVPVSNSTLAPGANVLELGNGTWAYTITPVAGYSTTYSASVVVVGAAKTLTISFRPFTYAVSFSESGLPAGSTTWGVTLAGSSQRASVGSPIAFASGNGTFAYNVSGYPGYSAKLWAGSVTVAAAPVTTAVLFVVFNWTLTFTESGLRASTSWNVTLGAQSASSTSSTIAFRVANGTYGYAVGALAGYTASPSGGSIGVDGAPVGVAVAFTASVGTYAVTFTETGLPSGTNWTVTLNGTAGNRSSVTNTISFSLKNSTYDYALRPIPGQSTSWRGLVIVSGANAATAVAFSPFTYAATFTESGLSSGSVWYVNFTSGPNGTTGPRSGPISGSSFTFSGTAGLANGSYAYAVKAESSSFSYPHTGALTESAGSPSSFSIAFLRVTFPITFSETGLPSGTLWFVNFTAAPSGIAPPSSGAISATSYTFTGSLGLANGSYTYSIAAESSLFSYLHGGTVSELGGSPSSVAVAFSQVTYSFAFKSTGGLPSGTVWFVNLTSGPSGLSLPKSGPITTMSFIFSGANGLSNGTYQYSISVEGPYVYVHAGSVTESGGTPTSIPLTFSEAKYTVTFTEEGLPSGSWGVTFNDQTNRSSVGSPIVVSATNNSYFYNVSPYAGYVANRWSNTLTVKGASLDVSVVFTESTYALVVNETGLAAGGPSWGITVEGAFHAVKVGTNLTLSSLANGTYAYNVSGYPGYTLRVWEGELGVEGPPAPLVLAFARTTYLVTLEESGLPSGSSWTVTLGGSANSTLAPGTNRFDEPNGSFLYRVSGPAGYVTPAPSGTITVASGPLVRTFLFTQLTYRLTFTETGLAAGTLWSVTVGAFTNSSTTTTVGFVVANGTYPYAIGALPGYTTSPYSGSVTVDGFMEDQPVSFSPVTYSLTFTERGLASSTRWTLTVNGVEYNSTSTTISLSVGNGSYGWSVSALVGYSATPAGGEASVSGSPVGVAIRFAPIYTITFEESGLPTGALFNVTFNGTTKSATVGSSGASVAFTVEALATYAYQYGQVAGFTVSAFGGSLAVTGDLKETAGYTAGSEVAFTSPIASSARSERPTTTPIWSVAINGGTYSAPLGSPIDVWLANGTYPYAVTMPSGYTAPATSGQVAVSGALVTVPVAATPTASAYTLTFTETGLPTDTRWNVTVDGFNATTTGTTLALSFANGSYAYVVGAPAGFRATPGSGTVAISGRAVGATIAFAPPSSPSSSASLPWLYIALGGVAVVVAAIAVVLLTTPAPRGPGEAPAAGPSGPAAALPGVRTAEPPAGAGDDEEYEDKYGG